MNNRILFTFLFLICSLVAFSQFPTEKDFGLVVSNNSVMYSLPKEESSKVTTISLGTIVYAVLLEKNEDNLYEDFWCVVKTGSGQMGYMIHSDVALFKQSSFKKTMNIAGENYNLWTAEISTNPYKEEDGEIIPFLTDNAKRVHFIKTFSIDETNGGTLKATSMFDLRSWIEVDYKIKIKYEFTQTEESGESSYGLYRTSSGEIYALLENENDGKKDFSFVVADSKTSIYDSKSQIIDYLNQWEVALRKQETTNCYTQILTQNFKEGYVYRTAYCGTHYVSFFNKAEGEQVSISGKTYDVVVAKRMETEEMHNRVLLVSGHSGVAPKNGTKKMWTFSLH